MWGQFLKSIKNSRKHKYINVEKVFKPKYYWGFFSKKKNQITATWQQIKKLCRDVNMSWFFLPQRPRSGFSSLRWVKKILKSGKIISTTQIEIKWQVLMKNSISIGPRMSPLLSNIFLHYLFDLITWNDQRVTEIPEILSNSFMQWYFRPPALILASQQ